MMKTIFYYSIGLLCFLTSGKAYSQTQLKGQVAGPDSQPIPFANVLLLSVQDSSLVTGVVTNEAGYFELEINAPDSYLLAASMVGYQTTYTPPITVLPGQPQRKVGTIMLTEAVQTLGEVVVEGQKPLFEQGIDRLTVNVQQSITSAGGTALDILERSPGVVVNRQSRSLALGGKDGVAVMINGKLSHLPMSAVVDMLQGMHGSTIEKIELITNPPARYEAEGTAGIINIVLKKNQDTGVHGSYALTAGYGWAEKTAGSTNLNYRGKKLSLSGDYSFLRNRTHEYWDSHLRILHQGLPGENSNGSERKPIIYTHHARVGFDYAFTPQTFLGGTVAGYSNRWTMDAFNQGVSALPNTPTTFITVENKEINHWRHLMGNLNLDHTFNERQEIRLDLDYLWYHDNNPTDYTNTFINAQEGDSIHQEKMKISKRTPINIAVAKVDYRHQINDRLQWDTGLKGSLSRFTNDVAVTNLTAEQPILDEGLSGQYRLHENIAAAYTSWQWQMNESTQIIAGVRYELTDTDLSSTEEQRMIDRRYGKLFPSLLFAHDLTEEQGIQLSYSRRITRPTFNNLAPFMIFLGPNNLFTGNPALQPSISDALKAEYRWKEWLFSWQWGYEQDAIADFQPRVNQETRQVLYQAENLSQRTTHTLTAAFPWEVTAWWSMQNVLTGTRQKAVADYLIDEISVTQYSLRLHSTQRLQFSGSFALELSGYFQSPFLYGITTQRAMGTLNVGVEKKLKDERGTLRLTMDDIFWTTSWQLHTDFPELHLDTQEVYKVEPRVIKLTYSRNFGKKLKPARTQTTGSEEEQKRVH